MSVVAAKVYPNYIEIAADSILLKEEIKRTNVQKLIVTPSGIVVGGCGECEELSLFFEFVKTKTPSGTSITNIQQYMKRFAEYKEEYRCDRTINNEYLMIFEGHLYEIQGMFIRNITDYTAIGQGESYALTALYLGQCPRDAVETACNLCTATALPVNYYIVNLNKNEVINDVDD